jgi:hypothetical protein
MGTNSDSLIVIVKTLYEKFMLHIYDRPLNIKIIGFVCFLHEFCKKWLYLLQL